MIEAFWIPLLPPYLIGLVLSFAVEALLTPRPVAPWRRPMAAVGVHVGVWTVAFALELMLFRRPYFAVANVLAIELLIVLVSNAKFAALKEPFVYPDFEYFLDAIKHPRLYLPFFGVGKALAAVGGYGMALWAGLHFEDTVTGDAAYWPVSAFDLMLDDSAYPITSTTLFFLNMLGLLCAGSLLAIAAAPHCKVDVNALADLKNVGLIGALWSYARIERLDMSPILKIAPFGKQPVKIGHGLDYPDLVVVQSESFCDIRRAYPNLIPNDVLKNFDLLKTEAIAGGRLDVPAWGANTVRTEFSFLTALDASVIGVHQFNPYRRLAAGGVPTIASHLKKIGYRTVCIHPYHRSFYGRSRSLPRLGFDEFLGIECFDKAELCGAYVSDKALAQFVSNYLDKANDSPLYIHVITMENHGPLHWEPISTSELDGLLNEPVGKDCRELIAYVRHLRNADEMFGALRSNLQRRKRSTAMCIFGDHVPIMPAVTCQLGKLDGFTDYLIWKSGECAIRLEEKDRGVSELALDYLTLAGLLDAKNT